jgi:exodeoxyribonuclease V beta subunit
MLGIPLGLPAFRLSEIQKSSRLSELEFTFPVNGLTATRLHDLLIKNFGSDFPETIGRLQFQPARGFMKGFIDLVVERAGKFYIFDWKSNWLGPSTASYAQQNLAAEMVRNFYVLQLSIYTVALHRYLAQRMPRYDYEKNFGGVFYIFLRGVDAADPRSGVFPARPALGFVEAMNTILNGDT